MSLYGLRTFQIVNIIVLIHNEIQPIFKQFLVSVEQNDPRKIVHKNYNG